MVSLHGGIDIESLPQEKIFFYDIDPLKGISPHFSREISSLVGFTGKTLLKFSKIIVSLYECFSKYDLKMIEINPLVLSQDNEFVALDCVSVIDDDSLKRHNFSFPPRNNSKNKTQREIEANKIDQLDHSGVCGRTFIDLDGDIGVLSSGGGASVTAMDALLSYGGKPANFTEYSGNPSYDKVKKLTEIVLDAPLSGLFVVGGRANFTRVDETLSAILEVLIEKRITIPVVIRRAGPGEKKAYDMFMEAKERYGINVEFYFDDIPISKAAEIMVNNVKQEVQLKNVNITR